MKKVVDILLLFATILTCLSCEKNPVDSVTLDCTELQLNVGDKRQIEVRVFPLSAAYYNSVSWSSSNESVAVVATDGTVTAVYSGECVITAKAGKKSATCKVKVNDLGYNLKFDNAKAFYDGDSHKAGTNNIIIRLYDKDLTIDDEGSISGEGLFLNFDINVNLSDRKPCAGNYELSDKREESTFAPGTYFEQDGATYVTGTFLAQRSAEGMAVVLVKSGSFWLKENDSTYTLEAHLLGDHNEEIVVKYAGKMPVFDTSGETPTESYTFKTNLIAIEFGGVDNTLGLSIFNFKAADNDTVLQFSLYVPQSVTTTCPNGIYNFNGNNYFSIKSGTFHANGTTTNLINGTVKIAQELDKQTIECSFIDKSNKKIGGFFIK